MRTPTLAKLVDPNPPWKIKHVVRLARTTSLVVKDAIIKGELHEVGFAGSGELEPWEAADWVARQWTSKGNPVPDEVHVARMGLKGRDPVAPPRVIAAGEEAEVTLPSGQAAKVGWQPNSRPQSEFLRCSHDDVFYGGARGGGKTYVCVGDNLWRESRFGGNYSSIIFRRTYDELEDVKNKAVSVYSKFGWVFNEAKYIFKSPRGALTYLRYFDSEEDYGRYHGWSVCTLYFDELPAWPRPEPLDKLWSILRSAHGIPCVRRSTGNPGGPGMAWVKKRYRLGRDVCEPYKTFWYQPMPEIRPDLKVSAIFIPAKLEDNVDLASDPTYEARLAASAGSVNEFKAWREGDWDAVEGAYFQAWNPDIHVYGRRGLVAQEVQEKQAGRPVSRRAVSLKQEIDEPAVIVKEDPRKSDVDLKPWFTRWISIDWGYAHAAAVLWFCTDGERVYVYREYVMKNLTPTQLAEAIVTQNAGEKMARIVIGKDAFERRTSETTIADIMGSVFQSNRLPYPHKAQDRNRVQGWQIMNQAITAEKFRAHVSCKELIRTIPSAVQDPEKREDVQKFAGDDALEACRNGLRENPAAGVKPTEVTVEEAYQEALKRTGGDMHSAQTAAFMAERRERMREIQGILGLDFRGRRARM